MDDGNKNPQDDLSIIDKVIQNNPFVKPGQAQYQNVQTQSVVKSTREEADAQLAAINAQQAEIQRQQKMAEDAMKAKRLALYIGVGVLFAVILAALVWVIVNAVIASQRTVVPVDVETPDDPTATGRVEGYKCKETKCEKVAEIDSDTILVRDGSQFYLYVKTSKATTLTAIPSNEYHSINIFKWAGENYAVLDPESGQSALFNVAKNRQVTEFSYDEFYTDIKAEIYKEMTAFEKSYIIAKSSGSYRLIDLTSGSEKIRANKKVFVYDKYFYGYENDGSIHVYDANSAQFVVVNSGSNIFVKNSYLIIVDENSGLNIYTSDGKQAESNDFTNEIQSIQSDKRLTTLTNDKTFYHIPENK